MADLDEKAAQLRSDIGNLTERISDLHHIARRDRREASVGVKLDSLVAMNGRDYKDVEITSITDAGLIINHSSGIARLVASDLSKEQQFQFGIDSQLSQEAVARESAKVVAYHRLVDEHTEQTLAQKEVEDRRIAILPRPSPRVVSDTTVASGNPLHEPPRPIGGSRYRSYYRADYYNRYSSYYQPNSRTTYSPPGPATRYSVPGSGRRINGTPAPTRTSPPRSTPSLPCPND